MKNKIVGIIKSFTKDPVDNLGVMLPVLVGVIALLEFVTAYIMFIVNGGYTGQIDLVKTNGFNGIKDALTSGTVYIFYSGIVPRIISVLLIIAFIIIMIAYFAKESKAKKILMIINLGSITLFGGIVLLIIAIYRGIIQLTEDQKLKITAVLDDLQVPKLMIILLVIAILALLTIISFLILSLKAKSGRMFKNNLTAALLSFVGLPLLLLFLENIVPLLIGVIALVVIGIFIFITILVGAERSASVSSGSSSSGRDKSFSGKSEGICKRFGSIIHIKSTKLRKSHGPMDNHFIVAYDDSKMKWEYVCSLKDFRKGRVHLLQEGTGIEFLEEEIPWKD